MDDPASTNEAPGSVFERLIVRVTDCEFDYEAVLTSFRKELDASVIAGDLPAELAESFFNHLKEFQMMAFIGRMRNRQGSRLPDFDALYARREELDRATGCERPAQE